MSISAMVNGVYRNIDTYPSNLNLDGYTAAPRKTRMLGTNLYAGFEIGGSTSWSGTKEFIVLCDNKIVYNGKLTIITPNATTSSSVTKTDISGTFPTDFVVAQYGFYQSNGFHIYTVFNSMSSLSSQNNQIAFTTLFKKAINFATYSVYYK